MPVVIAICSSVVFAAQRSIPLLLVGLQKAALTLGGSSLDWSQDTGNTLGGSKGMAEEAERPYPGMRFFR